MNQTDFERQIQQWIILDNQSKALNDKLKELRDNKNALNLKITSYAEKNNLFNSAFKSGDDKIKFGHVKTQQQITLTYLQKCLAEVIKNESQAKQIFEYIKNNRESKLNSEIRRI